MKILVNATTCVVGGGAQVASSFIRQSAQDSQHLFFYAVSPLVKNNIGDIASAGRCLELTPSPAKLIGGRKTRGRLKEIERMFDPDIVFTVFGPSYHRFNALHLCGMADGWVTHRSKLCTGALTLSSRLKMLLTCQYKCFRLSKRDYYWLETEVAREGLIRLIKVHPQQTKVIPNSYSTHFNECTVSKERENSMTRVFTLAAPYPHKNLCIIPDVASILQKRGKGSEFKFVVTLPSNNAEVKEFWSRAHKLRVAHMIENVGQLPIKECPKHYGASDIVFLPTLLETFSVTFLEAMKMQRPIVTTDLDFAHDTCGDAALYYSPLSPAAAADCLIQLHANHKLYSELVKRGSKRLGCFPTPDEKYAATISWIEEVADRV